CFTEYCQFFGWRQTTDVADVDAYKINQVVGNEGHPFLRIVKDFAHGNGSGDLLAEHLEPHVLFRWQGVFQKEESVRFKLLGHTYRLDRCQMLMDIMQQLHLVAQMRTEILKEAGNAASVGIGVEIEAGRCLVGCMPSRRSPT